MAALTLATMQARVAMNCNNLQTSDPVYTDSNSLKDYINEAPNRVIMMAVTDPLTKQVRRNFDMFPELRDRRWVDVTVNNQNYLLPPSTCLVPDSLTYTKLTTSYDQSRDPEYHIEPVDVDEFALLSRTTTTVGWPQLWCYSAGQIQMWPTPTTAFLTNVVLRGVRKESDLSGSTDTLTMSSIWHPAIVDMATCLTMRALGWHEDAQKFEDYCIRKVSEAVSLLGSFRRRNKVQFGIAGSPK